MGEADVFNLELILSSLPFRRPGQMRFVELLTKSGNFNLVGLREKNLKHDDPASWSGDASRVLVQLETDGGFGKAAGVALLLELRQAER
jgi:hypothetical protein